MTAAELLPTLTRSQRDEIRRCAANRLSSTASLEPVFELHKLGVIMYEHWTLTPLGEELAVLIEKQGPEPSRVQLDRHREEQS